MNLIILSLLSLAPIMASAASMPNAAIEIERSYHPKIEIRKSGFGLSLYGCTVEKFRIIGQDPITHQDRTVTVSLYHSSSREESRRAVLILPPTGGVNVLDKGYANEFCSSGITTALISGWEHQNDASLEFNMHNNGALRALAASRHTVELLNKKGFSSIGILGTSIGAIAGMLVLEFEPRISSAALIVGSARFADVIAESDESGASALRKNRMKAFAFKSADDYRQALREKVWVEPSRFIGRLGRKDALIVSADADTTVPSAYQMELAQILNAKRHIRLQGNHLQVIKNAFFYHRSEITNFFLDTL